MQQGQQYRQLNCKSLISNTEPSINNNTNITTCSRTTTNIERSKCTTGRSHCTTSTSSGIDDHYGVGTTKREQQGKKPPPPPPQSGTYIGTYRRPISRGELIGTMNKSPPQLEAKDLCKNQCPIGVGSRDEETVEYYTMLERMSSLSSFSAATSSGLVDTGNTKTYNDSHKAKKKQPPSPQSQQRLGSLCHHYYQNTMLEQQQQEGEEKCTDLRLSIISTDSESSSSPIQELQNYNNNQFLHMSLQEQQEVLLQKAKDTLQNENIARMIQENEMIARSQIECQLLYDTQIAKRLQQEEEDINNSKDNNDNTTTTIKISSAAELDNCIDTSHDVQIAMILQKELLDAEELERKRIEQLDYKIAQTLHEILNDIEK